jgi:TolB-like protein
MPFSAGDKLGPYEIVASIGAGGMGEVYRARDAKLGREVALKVLPAEMAHDPERLGRFHREAKALAQLDHPNIVTIHSVEECDGVHFLTMQLVVGQSLDCVIPVAGLPLDRIVEIATALGDALAAAHDKAIVHRDLKPANVMVTSEGRVKVLDFGLAKDVRPAGSGDATLTSASQTQVGVVMGTPAYMSPEQTTGRPLDHRTDIFSLGVVLHEMATGRRPFEGTSSAELVSAILRDTPLPVTDARPDLPGDLARIIRRCLEKDPSHRVQTARDVSNEFRDLARQISQRSAPAAISTSPSRAVPAADSNAARTDEGFWVAVLPFRGASGDTDVEALADGLTEDITAALSRFSYLQVIAHNSAMASKGRVADIRTVGRELGARYVIEGSIRKKGPAVRVSAQLTDTMSGTQLWAEAYDREIGDVDTFQIQDDLTDHIVTSVADGYGVLVRSMAAPTRDRKVEELSASELVLRHYAFMQQVNPQEHAVLRAGLERALEREPNHANAWACLSNLYQLEYFDRFNPQEKPLERARDAAWRAVKIDPACQTGWKELAAVHFFSRDFIAFRETAERARSLNPRDGTTLAYMAIMIAFSGDWERGAALAQRAIDLNRHHPGWYHNVFFHHHYRKGEYEAALQAAKRINMPEYHWMQLMTAATCGMLGRQEEARTAIESLRKYNPTFLNLKNVREDVEMWDPDKDEVEKFLLGLQKAGMTYESVGPAPSAASPQGGPRNEEVSTRPKPISGIRRHAIVLTVAAILLVIGLAGVGVYLNRSNAGQLDSIAVLPLENRSNDPDADYISDGITESINNSLARLPNLRVIPHSVASHYRGKAMDMQKVGDELRVQAVLTGSVAQRGDQLTVNVELDDVHNGKQLWGQRYNRKLADLLAVQTEIARKFLSFCARNFPPRTSKG